MGRTRTANKGLPPRLIVRRWKSRGRLVEAFYYDGRENGKRIFIPLGQERTAALRKWAELEGVKPSASGTFDAVANRYVKEVLPLKPKATQADYSNSIGMLRKVFGPHPIEAIKPKHVAQYRDTRKAKVRANREIAVLSLLWNQSAMGLKPTNGFRAVRFHI